MNKLLALYSYMGKYRKDLYLAVVFVFIETCFELAIPMMMADLIDNGVARRDIAYMLMKGGQMCLCGLLSFIMGISYARFQARASYGWGANIREAEFRKVQSYAFQNIDRFSSASLVTRMTSDVTVLQNTIANGLRPFVRSPIMLCLGILFSIRMNAELALVFVILAPILGCILFLIIRKAAPNYVRLQRTADRLNSVVEENLRAIRLIKAFVKEEDEAVRFDEVNAGQRDTLYATNRVAMLNMPAFQAVMYTSIVMFMWFGGNLVLASELQIGELTGFLSYVMQVLNSLMMLSNVFLLFSRSLASAERVSEVLSEAVVLESPSDAVKEVKSGDIEFEDVSFKYFEKAKENILSALSFSIPAGSSVGIVGATGSGKTSLVSLLPRLYDVSAGSVRIGGLDVRSYDLEALRESVVIVLQKSTLFSGTLRENLLWGDEKASDEELWEALKMASAEGFVTSLDAQVQQGGVNFSGGQRQRLCIARALLRKPKVIVFDDSTSALDTATEKRIRQNLDKLEGVTRIFIAHRISSVRDADIIMVLEEGRLAGIGRHQELLGFCQIYREIYESQNKGGAENG